MASKPVPDQMRASGQLDRDTQQALAILRGGQLHIEGRIISASNVSLYCTVENAGANTACIYKPIAGESPLWDFPDGTLAAREYASFLVSESLAWHIVPPTALRDGPLGPGMVQLWVEGDDAVNLLDLVRSDRPALRRIALFDAVVNNADRKGSHLIPMPDGHIYGIDHGVSFAATYKLRTLLWRWAGEELTTDAIDALIRLRTDMAASLSEQLKPLLTDDEITAFTARVEELLASRTHPEPRREWPATPWPPF